MSVYCLGPYLDYLDSYVASWAVRRYYKDRPVDVIHHRVTQLDPLPNVEKSYVFIFNVSITKTQLRQLMRTAATLVIVAKDDYLYQYYRDAVDLITREEAENHRTFAAVHVNVFRTQPQEHSMAEWTWRFLFKRQTPTLVQLINEWLRYPSQGNWGRSLIETNTATSPAGCFIKGLLQQQLTYANLTRYLAPERALSLITEGEQYEYWFKEVTDTIHNEMLELIGSPVTMIPLGDIVMPLIYSRNTHVCEQVIAYLTDHYQLRSLAMVSPVGKHLKFTLFTRNPHCDIAHIARQYGGRGIRSHATMVWENMSTDDLFK